MTDADRIIAQVDALRADKPRGGLLIAVGLLAATVAIALLAILIARDREHVARIASLQAIAVEQQRTAQDRIADLQRTLARLPESGNTTPLVRQAIAQATAAERSLDGADASLNRVQQITAPVAGLTAPAETPIAGVQTVSNDRSAGWDLDVFWCAGAAETDNYAGARAIAMLLGAAAASRTPIASGVSLGRVRLRPVRVQDRAAWPTGYFAVSDIGRGEDDAVRAIADYLSGQQSHAVRTIRSRAAPTRWYLSVFACEA